MSKIQTCTTELASYSLTQWQFWQFTLKWLFGARAQDKTKQYYCCFLFFLFLFKCVIQGKSITWLVNSALNCTWKPILHPSPRDSCEIGFRVQFNTEFPRQVMNFLYSHREDPSGISVLSGKRLRGLSCQVTHVWSFKALPTWRNNRIHQC